ncbi:hypothetical protein HYALB_00011432 [Hymenoscyphus albidus]|uniref:Heterokaryon incompatibility domain-containing protein n=1 Tax=Hymenoscyphus albidus TaxID=595503 RepID=A0A9N9Q881_9HELO|nr:hypothetical protein HYALB_00011432 [Hymenoscyphus albidus]
MYDSGVREGMTTYDAYKPTSLPTYPFCFHQLPLYDNHETPLHPPSPQIVLNPFQLYAIFEILQCLIAFNRATGGKMTSISGSEDASGNGSHQRLSQRRRLKASPPACPVCLDLRPDLLQTYHEGPTLTTRCGSVFEQNSCRICRYITDAILQLSKPLVADHVDLIPSLHPIELEVVLHEGYNTEVKVSILGFDLSVEIFALTGFSSPVFAFEDAPDRPAVLDITTCTQFIERYLEECEEDSHSCCESEVSEMPTRLLFIGSTGSPCLKLVEAPSTKQKYVALSHCWGDQSGILKTTKSTLEERLLDISWNSLSKTFQDSIQITRSLDIKFLWIDSLCIVQNDPSDWEKETVKMAQIYSQAYLIIAAASASSGSMGCLSQGFLRNLGTNPFPPFAFGTKMTRVATQSMLVTPLKPILVSAAVMGPYHYSLGRGVFKKDIFLVAQFIFTPKR